MPLLRGGTKPLEIIRPDGIPAVDLNSAEAASSFPTVGGRISRTPVVTAPEASFGVTDQYQPPKAQSASSGNLAARLQLPQLQNPSLQPPISVPQNNAQPQIMLPEMYRQTGQGSYPSLNIRGGITMPSATPGVNPQKFPSMNWADFLTVAHAR